MLGRLKMVALALFLAVQGLPTQALAQVASDAAASGALPTACADELGEADVIPHEATSVDAVPVATACGGDGASDAMGAGDALDVGLPAAAAEDDEVPSSPDMGVIAHVATIGWLEGVAGGAIAGVTGKALGIEAVRLSLAGVDADGGSSVEYRAWVAGAGWQPWVRDGADAGTTHRALAIEALQVRLVGPIAETHEVCYQAHVSDVGWMSIVRDGASAGAVNCGRSVEALRVWVIAKGDSEPVGSAVATGATTTSAQGLTVRAHVSGDGWHAPVGEGQTAGSTGRARAVEALAVYAGDAAGEGGISYEAHVAGVGWQEARTDGGVAGTTGRGHAIEALRMRPYGDLATTHDLYYRVHVANVGWLGWAMNGADAGSVGMALAVEAVQVRLVGKGAPAPTSDDARVGSASLVPSHVSYEAHVQGIGWQGAVGDGAIAGATGRGLRLEALAASLASDGPTLPGSIRYRAHVSDIGWQDWREGGSIAGTVGEGRRIEALELSLSGPVANVYDLWYRTHVEDFGWLGWTKGGATSGTTGIGKRVEAVELRLVLKSGAAPGSTERPYIGPDYYWDDMTRRAQGYTSPTGQLVMVDLAAHRVGIYESGSGYWRRIRSFACSSGAPNSPTVRGVFHIGSRGYVFGSGYSCYYWTQFYGAYLFHSVLYNQGTRTIQDGRLGMDISHGCVRLAIGDAQYINEHVRTGTTVVVYR